MAAAAGAAVHCVGARGRVAARGGRVAVAWRRAVAQGEVDRVELVLALLVVVPPAAAPVPFPAAHLRDVVVGREIRPVQHLQYGARLLDGQVALQGRGVLDGCVRVHVQVRVRGLGSRRRYDAVVEVRETGVYQRRERLRVSRRADFWPGRREGARARRRGPRRARTRAGASVVFRVLGRLLRTVAVAFEAVGPPRVRNRARLRGGLRRGRKGIWAIAQILQLDWRWWKGRGAHCGSSRSQKKATRETLLVFTTSQRELFSEVCSSFEENIVGLESLISG